MVVVAKVVVVVCYYYLLSVVIIIQSEIVLRIILRVLHTRQSKSQSINRLLSIRKQAGEYFIVVHDNVVAWSEKLPERFFHF